MVVWDCSQMPLLGALGSGINVDPCGTTVFSGTSGAHWSILVEQQSPVVLAVPTGDIMSITLPINVNPHGTTGLSGTGQL